ncbi:uncharacterized protein DS421_3g74410 [Arachis hypogaea]|nr:uncharacterized protein DS421_3g74410 [Arachis hypogaea]
MEDELRKFTYFVVTKGWNTGLFTSFDKASAQVVDYPNGEYQAFNCQALAVGSYYARLKAIEKEKEALDEMMQQMGQPDKSPPKSPPTIVTENGRRAHLCRWINYIPLSEVASGAYAVNLSMEELLHKNLLGADVHTKGRYSPLETDAKEDAAYNMLQKVLHTTDQEIRDFNYLKAKMLERTNNALSVEVQRLEEKCRLHGYNSNMDNVSP